MAKVSIVSLGGYGRKIAVPVNRIGALMEILAACQYVDREWLGSGNGEVYSLCKAEIGIELVDSGDILTEDQLLSIKESIEAEKIKMAVAVES